MKTIYTKYITLNNGKRIYASAYDLDAFKFQVTDEEYEEYMKNR